MAITTKSTYTHNGITYGLSDDCNTLFNSGNLTASELARFSWCRWNDKYVNCMAATNLNLSQEQGAAAMGLLSYFNHDGETGYLKTKYVDDRISTVTPYAFNILVYGNTFALNINSSNGANYKIVTSCSDFQKLYVKVDYYSEEDLTVQFPETRTIKNNRLSWESNGVYNTDNNQYSSYIKVCTVIVLDENTFFITKGMSFPGCTPGLDDGVLGAAQNNLRPSNHLYMTTNHATSKWWYTYGDITTYDGSKHLARWYKNGLNIAGVVTWDSNVNKSACWDVDNDVSVFMTGYWGVYNYTYFLRTENAIKNSIAYTGLRWKYTHGDTDHIYTPIINDDGYITGYSTDPNAKTKLNNISDVTGNNISPLPPKPSSNINDKELDMSTIMLSSNAGMVHYYEINKTGTATANQISDAISRFDISTIGKDLMRNLISFKAFAVLPTSEVFNNIIHVSGKDLKDENDNYLMGDVIRGMSKLSLGTITIPTLYNDYRDYEPYTRIEMFVPFCGWFTLPSWSMGKTITGEMFVDLYNGTCKAIIKASDTVVAEIGGNVAYDIPFVAESTGAKASAVISSALTTAVSAAGFAATPNIATGAAALSSAANLASAVNSSQTTLKGVLGDGSNLNGLNRCFIKVTRPQSPNGATNIPDIYKHEIGIPTMKEVTISAGDGYIQVMDAKVNGTMTAREKQMIVDGFRHGLNF